MCRESPRHRILGEQKSGLEMEVGRVGYRVDDLGSIYTI